MTNSSVKVGGKRRGPKGARGRRGRGSRQNQNQNQNQHGGACGNSSSVAAAYGGSVPMMNVQQGGSALASSAYGSNASLGGNVSLVKGGASIIPQMGGNAIANIPPGMPTATTGGNMLNELAVPAVLLYANNTFGKKRSTGKKYRRSGKRSRRFRRR
jgi:hypothetical protein